MKNAPPRSAAQRLLWTLAGWLSLALAALGIVLPVLPTTPLVLLAAFAFARGSPRLRAWLDGSKHFGPLIADWETTGAIPRRAKILACALMALVFLVSLVAQMPYWILAVQAVCMSGAAAFVLTRPDSTAGRGGSGH
ncbi:YbaN family protein [Roseovarius pelagicus]|uniref:YbaN family protein n=1 Tax=Roseovarius pelagicus TaxID=2980108 RepID=A0ABY6DCC4_9RHOB|nr:YbaN family protein [Roseovarius pelagicus]UXX83807.1 YbaN family protein [Roseovarius pelagicus]